MAMHFCTQYPCPQCGRSWCVGSVWNSIPEQPHVYNGLCQCRGPLQAHPFHAEPLPSEYVGRHRKPEE